MRRALLGLAALLPQQAYACAVCFGADKNGNIARAITIGIFIMLASVFSVLGALVAAVWRLERRKRLAEAHLEAQLS